MINKKANPTKKMKEFIYTHKKYNLMVRTYHFNWYGNICSAQWKSALIDIIHFQCNGEFS